MGKASLDPAPTGAETPGVNRVKQLTRSLGLIFGDRGWEGVDAPFVRTFGTHERETEEEGTGWLGRRDGDASFCGLADYQWQRCGRAGWRQFGWWDKGAEAQLRGTGLLASVQEAKLLEWKFPILITQVRNRPLKHYRARFQ
jgi:hypothetical protein